MEDKPLRNSTIHVGGKRSRQQDAKSQPKKLGTLGTELVLMGCQSRCKFIISTLVGETSCRFLRASSQKLLKTSIYLILQGLDLKWQRSSDKPASSSPLSLKFQLFSLTIYKSSCVQWSFRSLPPEPVITALRSMKDVCCTFTLWRKAAVGKFRIQNFWMRTFLLCFNKRTLCWCTSHPTYCYFGEYCWQR